MRSSKNHIEVTLQRVVDRDQAQSEMEPIDKTQAGIYDVDTCRYIGGETMATKRLRMELMVSKWGNSLALRLPAESARKMGVGEGDALIAEVSADGRLVLAPVGRAIGKTESRRLRQFLGRQKETAPVVGEMRRGARF
ncbi:MAG: AbrB/MazE/SpoVT family DNA-binding domain-containing protein [Burkholderiales bacterium]|nr:AbrB/MazE/SpoVT family DNA-binding domain-containing protein [Burkholderiales bacterium]